MTPQEIKLLKASYAQVQPIAEQAAELFYTRLFSIAPSVKPLFHNDMRTQGRMLLASIGLVVKNLDQPERITDMVTKMGQRHATYGARPEHYPVVGEALLWTLKQGLGEGFTPAHAKVWAEAYQILADMMIQAQQSVMLAKSA